ncbi:hypothetical protein PBY51_003098 [Eleginops maclovinus]|uniref:Uncharacterized protein n=1 Tax=Eleginops maclovinus TaxID=56733 RepID=A0AAN7XEA1_ELEMC|nr:hypothetical protein PBY51_003098 [Eleginops maclovinus]
MCARQGCQLKTFVGVLVLVSAAMVNIHGQAPMEINGISKRTLELDRDSPTQDTESEVHSVTTASPMNIPNHQPVLKGMLLHEQLLTRDFQGDQRFFRSDGSVAAYSTMPGSDLDPVTHVVPHEDAPAFSDIATTATVAATTPLTTFSPLPQKKSSKTTWAEKMEPTTDSLTTYVTPNNRGSVTDNPGASSSRQRPQSSSVEATIAPSSIRIEKGEARVTALKDKLRTDHPPPNLTTREQGPATTIITTITTMQTAEPCSLNFTDPEGNIEILQQLDSGVECNYLVTVYLGYGIEVQVSGNYEVFS